MTTIEHIRAAAPTAHSVAHELAHRVSAEARLSHDAAARELATRLGDRFVVPAHTGRLVIRPDVLQAFDACTKASVVWSRRERAWRLRTSEDPRRRQVD